MSKITENTVEQTPVPKYVRTRLRPEASRICFTYCSDHFSTAFEVVAANTTTGVEWRWRSNVYDGQPSFDDIDMMTTNRAYDMLQVSVWDEDTLFDEIEMPMLEFVKQRKRQETLEEEIMEEVSTLEDWDSWDYEYSLLCRNWYSYYMEAYKHLLYARTRRIKQENEIKALGECPVLHIPLTLDNAKQIVGCKHWLSQEAIDGMKKQTDEEVLKCPLCRENFHYQRSIA